MNIKICKMECNTNLKSIDTILNYKINKKYIYMYLHVN